MKYRKKPVVIDAEQWRDKDVLNLITDNFPIRWNCGVYVDPDSKTGYSIDTLEGKHEVISGDWIITGTHGEHYPVKEHIFPTIYEKVEE